MKSSIMTEIHHPNGRQADPTMQGVKTLRTMIALAMCPIGFIAALFITVMGWILGINAIPAALAVLLLIEGAAFVVALIDRKQGLRKVAMIAAGASFAVGTMGSLALLGAMLYARMERPPNTATFDSYVQRAQQPATPVNNPYPAASTMPATGYRSISINSVRLSDMQVAQLELAYGTHIPDGRYWVDAFGNYGLEGGMTLGNLGAASVNYGAGAGNGGGAQRRGPLTTRDLTGISVYDLR